MKSIFATSVLSVMALSTGFLMAPSAQGQSGARTLEMKPIMHLTGQDEMQARSVWKEFSNDNLPFNESKATFAKIDLNGDRQDELVLRFARGEFCNFSGCPTFVLSKTSRNMETALLFHYAGELQVDSKKTHGYYDLIDLGAEEVRFEYDPEVKAYMATSIPEYAE